MKHRLRRAALASALAGLGLTPGAARAQDAAACVAAANEVPRLRKEKRLGDAERALLVCAQDACDEVVRADCVTWLGEVRAARPTVVLVARSASGEDLVDVAVSVDGRRVAEKLDGSAVALDPGEHTLRFEAAGLEPAEQHMLLNEGQKGRAVEVVLVARSSPSTATHGDEPGPSLAVPAWITLGLGAASLTAFGVLQAVGQSGYQDLKDGCGADRSCRDEDIAPVETQLTASIPLLAVGSALVVTSVVLFVLDDDAPRERAKAAHVGAALGPGFGAASVGGAF